LPVFGAISGSYSTISNIGQSYAVFALVVTGAGRGYP